MIISQLGAIISPLGIYFGVRVLYLAIGIEVVNTMISRPMEDRPLIRHGVKQHEYQPNSEISLVGAMRPEAMHPASDAKCGDRPQHQCGDDGERGRGLDAGALNPGGWGDHGP